MTNFKKLELTWYGKDEESKIEPRILIEDKTKSNISLDNETKNMLIHGDNLLALKALESNFEGQIKCIYIDPPYNTQTAKENYDDNLEHSTWLSIMKPRLEILFSLLSKDGCIFIQIDDNEYAYLKVLCDEIFGRKNFLNTISVKMKNIAGASGGGEDKKLKKNIEYLLVYAKSYDSFEWSQNAYSLTELYDLVCKYRIEGVSWKYTSVLYKEGEKEYLTSTKDGDGNEIKIFNRKNFEFLSINQVAELEGLTEKEVYYKYIDKIHTTAMPQSSIRPRVVQSLEGINHSDLISIEYVPKTGKNKGATYEQFYKGEKFRLLTWLKDVSEFKSGVWYKKDLQGTLWDGINLNNLTKEGGVFFPEGKKPEELIKRIIDISTKEGDYVLDSFLGSGTTCAVAHKMKRNWIGIEMGNQAYTHCIPRFNGIINGLDKSGITEDVGWLWGGGYRFYELAPTLITEDTYGQQIINPAYDANMLAAAVALHEGYTYSPSSDTFWKQSIGQDNSYLFVTTMHIGTHLIDSISSQMAETDKLLIVCRSFDTNLNLNSKISIKKIPQSLLFKCEYGHDDYSLNIVSPPFYDDEME